jgi:lysophospholipid acyltransferase
MLDFSHDIYTRFFFPGFLVGPYLEYSTYISLIDESIYKSTRTHQNAASTKSGRNVPDGRKRVAYRKMAFGLAWLGVFVVLGGSYNFTVALQPWFATRSLLYR